jgi:hypothetical protein
MGFIRDLYNADLVRFTTVDDLSEDIMRLATDRLEVTKQHLASDQT